MGSESIAHEAEAPFSSPFTVQCPGLNAATKTVKFTIFRKTIDKVYEIYTKGCWEAPSKVMRIAKITKFMKTAKFTQWMKERTRYIHGIYIQLLC